MAVLSRLISDSADASEVADAVVIRGRSLSAPPIFEYEEEVRPATLPQPETQPPSKPKNKMKAKKRHYKRKKKQDQVLASAGMQNNATTIVNSPLIVDGACAPRPQWAQISSVEEEELAPVPPYTVVEMADGSRLSFPAVPSTHRHGEGPPGNFASDRNGPPEVANQQFRRGPINEEHYASHGVEEAGGRPRVSFPASNTMPYASGEHQAGTSSSAMSSHAYRSASDPGYMASPENSHERIYTPDSDNCPPESSGMEAAARDHTEHTADLSSSADKASLSSMTEAGSPRVADSLVAPSVETTSHRRDTSESTTIVDATSKDPEPAVSPASPIGRLGSRIHYIFINNPKKNESGQPSSTPLHASQATATTTHTGNADMSPLSHHLLDMFTSGQFADTQIVLNSASEMFWSITFNTHRVVTTQSAVLNSILERQAALEQSNPVIYLMGAKKFSLPRAFEFALQNLYGMPLIDMGSIYSFTRKALGWDMPGSEQVTTEKAIELAMDVTLCYGASGAFLNDARIVDATFELALQLIDWPNLETVFHFGIYPEDFLLNYDDSPEANKENEGKPKKGNKGKKKAQKKINEADLRPLHDNLNAHVVQKWAPKIANAAIQCLISNLPVNFVFDRMAVSKELQDRIPHHLRANISVSRTLNPSLAGLTFGHHPKPSPNCSRASGILLALPFGHFREWFEGMRQRGGVLTSELIKEILREREDRRLRALQEYIKRNPGVKNNNTNDNGSKQDHPIWLDQELGYQEFVIQVQTHAEQAGVSEGMYEFSLHREWKGLCTGNGGKIIRKFGE